ncbi:hypothetical protein [Bacillus sp. 2205SS5-2]|uniref:hypothetical protein n=1 Tax=Bacillus sp. 2205SS5-2 TaxID=3109031 RepID=UPI0030048CAB
MFTWHDVINIMISVLIILPLVNLIHQSGHAVFARMFGGKVALTLGRGKHFFSIGELEVKRIYFLDAFNQYEKLKVDTRWSHTLVYAGGAFFNLFPVLIVNALVFNGFIEWHPLLDKFTYFSAYFIFFSLFPVQYSEEHPSDGWAIYSIWKHGIKSDTID